MMMWHVYILPWPKVSTAYLGLYAYILHGSIGIAIYDHLSYHHSSQLKNSCY